jgi:hypothetical protein
MKIHNILIEKVGIRVCGEFRGGDSGDYLTHS